MGVDIERFLFASSALPIWRLDGVDIVDLPCRRAPKWLGRMQGLEDADASPAGSRFAFIRAIIWLEKAICVCE